ncbi:hypothetical protein GCM10010245_31720 [Streptomyces spectabilis]|uniref:Cytochrome C oxidase subunit I n=2 Tax=Streptomyces spectabilis TaxID=68270 RepID=A0A7W8AV55_STRST|nr:hypothetical protein [Streptomyces spectabilis]GGV18733.1 hypothetical protein GCM10010245_31720 [Streptomyces spectabilis]
MTAMDDRPVAPAEAALLIHEIEGHLLVESARTESRAAAARFTARLDWLSRAEREEVERAYAEDHLALTHRTWRHTAHRCRELRTEYETRYRALRNRLLAGCLLGLAFLTALALVLAGV